MQREESDAQSAKLSDVVQEGYPARSDVNQESDIFGGHDESEDVGLVSHSHTSKSPGRSSRSYVPQVFNRSSESGVTRLSKGSKSSFKKGAKQVTVSLSSRNVERPPSTRIPIIGTSREGVESDVSDSVRSEELPSLDKNHSIRISNSSAC